MNRSSLEHLIRAAANITGDHEIVIIGSQAIHGSLRVIPNAAQVSFEADMYPKNMPEKWELIEAILGEDSNFHETHKYYAQGVGPETAVLPTDWESRSININNESTGGASGVCIGLHDLVLSKYAAGREKDFIYVGEIIALGAVDKDQLFKLLDKLPADRCDPSLIKTQIERDFNSVSLLRAKGKISHAETFAIGAVSRADPTVGLALLELRDVPGFPIEKAIFEKPNDDLSIAVQRVTSSLNKGEMLHINELKKHWESAKKIDPSIANTQYASLTASAMNMKASSLPKSSMSDAISEINKDGKTKGSDFEP